MGALTVLVGILIVGIAFATVVGVLYLVMQEKHEHEDHYVPPSPVNGAPTAKTDLTPVDEPPRG
jgi:hypothetical protein